MTVTPLHNRILVRVDETPKLTPSGRLHVPDSVRHNTQSATVVAVGPGRVTKRGVIVPVGVEPGQRVAFRKYAGSDIRGYDDTHLMLSVDDVVGVWA